MTEVSTGNGNAKPKRNGKAAAKAGLAVVAASRRAKAGRAEAASSKPAKAAKAHKSRTVDPAKLDRFGLRLNSIKSRAASMYASKKGATLDDVRQAVGSVQFNVIKELEEKGFKIDRDQVPGKGARMATRYHLMAK